MRTAVIGLGNDDRGDDAVGLVVARRLRDHAIAADVHVWRLPELDLLETLPRYDRVFIVDAAHGGAPPGTIHHEAEVAADPATLGSHGFGLAGVLVLAEELGRLPEELHLVLVEIEAAEHGADLSPAVAAAADEVVRQLVRDLDLGGADVSR